MTPPEPHRIHAPGSPDSHEPDTFRVGRVALAMATLSIGMLLVMLSMAWLFTALASDRLANQADQPRMPKTTISESPLDANQPVALRKLRAAEQQRLESFAWVDREQGIARIPIAAAIQLLAKRGLPAKIPGAPLSAKHSDASNESKMPNRGDR